MFEPGYVHRQPSGVLAKELTFAALDLETTGLDPRVDRVCEVGVVRFRGDGTLLDEYATLVDPRRPISRAAEDRNEITPELVYGAPAFNEVVDDLLAMLQGSIVVAHNLSFEDSFLRAELRRCGCSASLSGLCTLVTCRAQIDGPSYRLLSLYKTATGDWPPDAHTALGDARALAVLVPWLIQSSPSPLYFSGQQPATAGRALIAPRRIAPRAARLSRRTDGYLGAIASRFPATAALHPVDPSTLQTYVARLDEAMADDAITGVEGWELEELARRAGLSQQSLAELHRDAWDRAGLRDELAAPDSIPAKRRTKLVQLAHDLGHPTLASGLAQLTAQEPPRTTHLQGWRVGADGEDADLEAIRGYVVQNGGALAKRITATVRFVATREPDNDTMLRKARELGIPIVGLDGARAELAAAVRAGETEDERRRREHEAWERDRAAHNAAQDTYFRHRWRPTEHDPVWELSCARA
jgi:DNA polymerase-3 subunit epsilon